MLEYIDQKDKKITLNEENKIELTGYAIKYEDSIDIEKSTNYNINDYIVLLIYIIL